MTTRLFASLAAVVLGLGLAGCTSATDEVREEATEAADAGTPAEGTVTFVGDDALQWAEPEKEATAVDGTLEVTVECDGAVPHNVVIAGVADERPLAACEGNDSGTDTVSIEPGDYEFWCSIPGHREAGMEGELTVTS